MIEEFKPTPDRCQHCIWSGSADIVTAFVVVDCGRHEAPDVLCHPDRPTANMREVMAEWGDRLTSVAIESLGPIYYGKAYNELDPSSTPGATPVSPSQQVVDKASVYAALDHTTNIPAEPLTTRELRSIAALMDEGAERIRAYENDLHMLREIVKEMKGELRVLRGRVRR